MQTPPTQNPHNFKIESRSSTAFKIVHPETDQEQPLKIEVKSKSSKRSNKSKKLPQEELKESDAYNDYEYDFSRKIEDTVVKDIMHTPTTSHPQFP